MSAPAPAVPGPAPFGQRLQAARRRCGPLVAGIDPHASLLEEWGLPDDPTGLWAFSRTALAAVRGQVAAIKPQSAFFERHGSAGVAVLEELLAAAREAGVLTILDVKRGDIGSTMGAYAAAHLLPGAPLEADAITVSPYLGVGSLDPALQLARDHGKGLFVLALTSNPGAEHYQHARLSAPAATDHPAAADDPSAHSVARDVARHAEEHGGGTKSSWGSIGLVVGATVGDAYRRLGLDVAAPHAPLLAPGFGAQGAGPRELTEVFGESAGHVLVALSRGLLSAGPDQEALQERLRQLRSQYR
ncbi:MAG TPA: orotidine-5'-phosphate decarboxylase [Candidatus Brachybacterium merdigallinarum]|nr:orotidine-5'-phosphate decarboxylase [Candidatus Brachybacterium merdigallinarum]